MAIVTPDGGKNSLPTNFQPASSKSRFVYADGARPLDGYTIRRGVGQGGFGEIYYAESDAGKKVALKLIRRNLDIELRGIRQCLNLKHPNLLDLYDIRQDPQGDTWVVMEYVADPCLEDVLNRRPEGMAPHEALDWICGIAAGVAYLHQRGIVHRDLKPANIFRDEGVVKVGDYGLAKFISCSRRSGHTESIGTVHYMAPEVANGRYGKEIDVYALGIIFFELLTGRVPFDGESIGEILMKHLTSKPDLSKIAEPYRGIIARALEKDPTLRYASAAEMLAALPKIGAIAGPASSGTPPIKPWPAWRPRREKATEALVVKPPRERLTELVGSMLTGALAAAVMSVVMLLLESYRTGAVNMPRVEHFAWLFMTATIGVWTLLIASKRSEGTRGDPLLRRFWQMVLGLGVGVASWVLADWLFVNLPQAAGYPVLQGAIKGAISRRLSIFYALPDGRPLLMAHVACFGTLFLLVRWWRQADPLRSKRLSLWTLFASMIAALLVALVWQFPQPWLPMVAAVMSVSLQLAGPWRRMMPAK